MAAMLCALPVQGAVIYDSISSVSFFSGQTRTPSAIGDLLTLAGTERLLTQATVGFFKSTADAGTGTLTLRFYDAGAPFGSLLGSYTQDFSTPSSGPGTITIPNLNLVLPNTVGVAATISSNAFINVLVHGPNVTVGSSANAFYTSIDGVNFTTVDLGAPHFVPIRLEAVDVPAGVPEPSTAALMGLGLATALFCVRRRRA